MNLNNSLAKWQRETLRLWALVTLNHLCMNDVLKGLIKVHSADPPKDSQPSCSPCCALLWKFWVHISVIKLPTKCVCVDLLHEEKLGLKAVTRKTAHTK